MSINFVKTKEGFVPEEGGEAVVTKKGLELRGAKVAQVKKSVKKTEGVVKKVKAKLKKKK